MNKFSHLLLALLLVLFSTETISNENQSECYKAIDEYFEANIKLKMAKFHKHLIKAIPLNSFLNMNRKKMFKVCPQDLANYASNADVGDFFLSEKSKNKTLDENQFCMSSIFTVHFYVGFLEAKKTPPTIEERTELNRLFETVFDKNNVRNVCYKYNMEFYSPLQGYFSPMLQERVLKI
ncbi:MAG: hypothetical protein AB7I18_10230 [Candidatus Berkiella sp.]